MVVAHVINVDLHCGEGDMHRSAAHFDRDDGVQDADSGLEWF
jgi:hypothetical protein